MISILPMTRQEEWAWIKERAQVTWTEKTKGLVCYKDGEIVGMVIMDGWTHNSCRTHIAVDNMLIFKHGWFEEVSNYIYNECDKGVIIGVTPANLGNVLRFNRHVGFVETYRIPDGYEEGIDLVIQEKRKENCKYLRNYNGQRRSRSA